MKQKCDDRENFEAVIALSTKKSQSNQMLVQVMQLQQPTLFQWLTWYITEISTGGVLLQKGVYEIFANFIGKNLCWSVFLIKLQA